MTGKTATQAGRGAVSIAPLHSFQRDSIACTGCGVIFQPSHGSQRFCTPRCRWTTRNAQHKVEKDRRTKAAGGGWRFRGKSRDPEAGIKAAQTLRSRLLATIKKCPQCGTSFHPTNGTQTFCGRRCWKAATGRGILADTIRVCAGCGKEFVPRQSNQQYCSRDCWALTSPHGYNGLTAPAADQVYKQLAAVSGEVCGICGLASTHGRGRAKPYRLSVDHDHETGRIRGLLCHTCNTALGLFQDDPVRLEKAIAYLKRT